MPASALLKFTQGVVVGADGQALAGVLSTLVSMENVNNTAVASWQIDLAYVDPTSSLTVTTPYAFNNSSSTPAASFAPDVRRSYRWVLKVWSVANRVGTPDSIDIRVFTVRETNGALVPPSQVWPLPLPDPRSGEATAKPNEMNFGGQIEGWHGNGVDGLLNELLALHMPPAPGSETEVLTVVGGKWASAAAAGGGGGPGFGVMYFYDTSDGDPPVSQDGSAAKPFNSIQAAHDALPAIGGTIIVLRGLVSGDVTTALTKPVAILGYGPQLLGDSSHSLVSSSDLYVENITITIDEGGHNGIMQAVSLIARDCSAQFHATGGNLALLRSALAPGAQASSNIFLDGCQVASGLLVGGTLVRALNTTWPGSNLGVSFSGSPGVVQLDDTSNYWFSVAPQTITNGTKLVTDTAVQADGSVAFTADQSMGSHNLTDVLDPTDPQHAATKNYVDRVSTDTASTSRDFAASDQTKYLRTTAGTAVQLTVQPQSSVPTSEACYMGIQAGDGQVEFVQGAGVTINKPAAFNRKAREKFSSWSLRQKGNSDVFDLAGDLEIV